MYKCRYSNRLIDFHEMCHEYDDQCSSTDCAILNCHRGDDELKEVCISNLYCPKNCDCWNAAELFCRNGRVQFKHGSYKYFFKTLYLENVNGPEILENLYSLEEYYLIFLYIANSNLTEETLFLPFPNLKYLNISFNSIKILKKDHFSKTVYLEKLIFSDIQFELIAERAFNNLKMLKHLEFINTILRYLNKNLFLMSNKLKFFKIQNSKILNIDENFFKNLIHLEELNFLGSDLNEKNVTSRLNFQFNKNLRLVITDYYIICCFLKKDHAFSECKAKYTDFSSCNSLIGSTPKKG